MITTEILHLVNEMSPYLLLGFFIAGLMHAFIPGSLYSKYLSKRSFRSVLNAALLGIPLPLCSCGVIPTAMSLRKEGASKSAVVSFLIATPQTGVDSIVATYSLMGLPFAIIRPITALITALFGGQLVNFFDRDEAEPQHEEQGCCHQEPEKQHGEDHCCCCQDEAEEDHCCCHHDENHSHEEAGSCHCHHDDSSEAKGFWQKMVVALRYAFVDMVDDIGKWLVVGIVIAALITVFVPDGWFEVFKDNSLLSMAFVLLISIPMYVCATGSIPIAVALMMKGLTPGAGLVLLMAGPAANMASILIIRHRLGWRTLAAYIAAIVSGAVASGLIIDHLLPREWFLSSLEQLTCCESSGTVFEWICTGVLVALLLYAAYNRIVRKKPHDCHCCEH